MHYPANVLDHILCGDNVTILAQLPDASVDLVVTSPPYDHLRDYEGYTFDVDKIATELFRIVKDGGVVVWVVADAMKDGSLTLTSYRHAFCFRDHGFRVHDVMIYEKDYIPFQRPKSYHNVWEYMYIFSKGDPKTANLIRDRRNHPSKPRPKHYRDKKTGEVKMGKTYPKMEWGFRINIWRYVTGGGKSSSDAIAFEHPAIFPEALAKDHILTWSNEGDVVLDPFNGSGTTTKMAKTYGRHWIGIDISEKYCEIARHRLAHVSMAISTKTSLRRFL